MEQQQGELVTKSNDPKPKPDMLQVILAGIFDKFKVKNPKLFTGIILALTVLNAAILNCEDLGWCVEPVFQTVVQWVSWVLAILVAPRTSSILYAFRESQNGNR